jgi:oxygen-independent coproporphyrinogen III oxidase
MAGIYIHIPFCRQACNYCNFHFSTSLHYKNEFVNALLNEIGLQKQNNYLQGATVDTVYIGGGTPSLLLLEELHEIMDTLLKHFPVNEQAEITLEANPDDVTDELLHGWKETGINRLSIGIQSLFDEDLEWMNRAHNADEAKQVITKARAAGFNNFTVDLIYGTPGLTDERWQQNIDWVLQQNITHLSCYALTVEPKTPLDKLVRTHQKQDVDASQQSRQFIQLMNAMETAGFEHYEISNFAKPGHRSKHNSSYWEGVPYLGLGPSAHSFNGSSRQWNVANNQQYILSIKQNVIPFEKEELTPVQQLNEYIMTSLRLMKGCDTNLVEEKFGLAKKQTLLREAERFLHLQWMKKENEHLILTKEGKLFADKIAGELFF